MEWDNVPDVDVRAFTYAVWVLPHPAGDPVLVGLFELPRDSIFDLGLEGSPLINLASAIQVTLESEVPSASGPTPTQERLTHLAPAGPATLEQVRALLGSDPQTGTGFALRLAAQARALGNHVQLARDSAIAGNVVEARRSLEHALNVADLPPADHDGDGVVENPDPDDLGLHSLATRVAEVARQAAASSDAWADAIDHATLAALVSDTVRARLERLIALAENALAAQDLATLESLTRSASALADTLTGDPGAQVAALCARCGALTAWRQSMLMTTRRATPQDEFVLAHARVANDLHLLGLLLGPRGGQAAIVDRSSTQHLNAEPDPGRCHAQLPCSRQTTSVFVCCRRES